MFPRFKIQEIGKLISSNHPLTLVPQSLRFCMSHTTSVTFHVYSKDILTIYPTGKFLSSFQTQIDNNLFCTLLSIVTTYLELCFTLG